MKQNKIVIIALIVVILMLIFNLCYSVFELIDYNKRKESGNARWNEVEERIVTVEKEVNTLKAEVDKWKR